MGFRLPCLLCIDYFTQVVTDHVLQENRPAVLLGGCFYGPPGCRNLPLAGPRPRLCRGFLHLRSSRALLVGNRNYRYRPGPTRSIRA